CPREAGPCAVRRALRQWQLSWRVSAPLQPTWEEPTMTDEAKTQNWSEAFWYRGKVTRRRLIGYGSAAAGALGAAMLGPAPLQARFRPAQALQISTRAPAARA